MANMKDVARRAGVSIATVSVVLSGAAYVSPPLKTKVEAAIAELGYARNAMARSLKSGTSSLIGLIVPDITNPFFTSFVDHVQKLADQAGYSLLLGLTDNDARREPSALALMRSHQAAGTILCPTGGLSDYADIGKSVGAMKLVLADNAAPDTDVDTIVMNNALAAELAAHHILGLGHKRIAVVAGPVHQHVSHARHEAFLATLSARKLQLNARFVARGDFREQEAYDAARHLFLESEKPTAIFVANNLMLIGVMRAISDLALRVPDDVSVVSIDDFAWAAAFQPSLTVVRQPIADMAQAAFDQLLRRIAGGVAPASRQCFTPQLVIRQSCGRPA
jgi:LacI family transcriptional regulator